MNFFDQGLPLGKWFGIRVLIHWTFIVYIAYELFYHRDANANPLPVDALMMGLLFATVLIHEFGHALSCKALGGQAPRIILWPLGGIAFVQPPPTPTAWLITTICGPLVNAILWPIFYHISNSLGVTSEFGLAVWFNSHTGVAQYTGLAAYFLWQINKLLLLFNLIPAYPMDGGRILQELLWYAIGYARSRLIAGVIGIAAGVGFALIGLTNITVTIPIINYKLGGAGEEMLIAIGALCAIQSYAIVQHSLALLRAPQNPPA